MLENFVIIDCIYSDCQPSADFSVRWAIVDADRQSVTPVLTLTLLGTTIVVCDLSD